MFFLFKRMRMVRTVVDDAPVADDDDDSDDTPVVRTVQRPIATDPWDDFPDDCDWATACALARRRVY